MTADREHRSPARRTPARPRDRRARARHEARPVDRQLGPREPGAVGDRGSRHRAPQPALVDLRRVPRVRRLAAVEHRRRAAARGRVRRSTPARSSGSSRSRASSARPCASPTRSSCRCSAAATGRSSRPACCSCPTIAMAVCVVEPRDAVRRAARCVAALAGFGGGNFASSMSNITYFYPQREKGWALGLNAAGGNLGASRRPVRRADRRHDRRRRRR